METWTIYLLISGVVGAFFTWTAFLLKWNVKKVRSVVVVLFLILTIALPTVLLHQHDINEAEAVRARFDVVQTLFEEQYGNSEYPILIRIDQFDDAYLVYRGRHTGDGGVDLLDYKVALRVGTLWFDLMGFEETEGE